jgi:plasmid maintenance system antidote protein VapI
MRIEGGLFISVWDENHFDIVKEVAARKGEADITIAKKGDFYNLKAIVPVIQTIEQLKQAEKVERGDKWAPWPINQMGMCFMAAQKNAIPIALKLIEERAKTSEDQAVNLVKTISDTLYKWLIQQQERAIWEYENAEGLKEPEAKEEEEVEVTEDMLEKDTKGNPSAVTTPQALVDSTKTPLDTVSDGPVDVDDIPDGLKSEEQLKETADARLTKHE